MPSFNAVNIFGRCVVMSTQVNPRRVQLNGFSGLNGMEMLDLGSEGKTTQVRGLLAGANTGALGTAETLFRSYLDGLAYVLVDLYGTSHTYVTLTQFQPADLVMYSATDGYYLREYQAIFRHLV